MKQANGNLWTLPCDARCITTNGFTKASGEAVMGKGCAAEAVLRHPGIQRILGSALLEEGNHVHILLEGPPALLSFPVKPVSGRCGDVQPVRHMAGRFRTGDLIPGWACKADLNLIAASAQELVEFADQWDWQHILLPRPGCGAGELAWPDVQEVLGSILDDRFTCITF